MTESVIKEFFILGFQNERDVRITFKSPYKIIVADNGYGKTSVLNAFYALVSQDFSKLQKIQYQSIGIVFSKDNQECNFSRDDLSKYLEILADRHAPYTRASNYIRSQYGEEILQRLKEKIFLQKENKNDIQTCFSQVPKGAIHDLMDVTSDNDSLQLSFNHEVRRKKNHTKNKEENHKENYKIISQVTLIRMMLPFESLYLPTYRRVETDIESLYDADEDEDDKKGFLKKLPIQFGMQDVRKSIEAITSQILTSSSVWFAKINGKMLTQLIDGFNVTDEMKNDILDPEAVKIVLGRIGNNISIQDKDRILDLVHTKQILSKHEPLLYFVSNLIKVYERQKENDKAIQNFVSVLNKYFKNKKVIYNESKVEVKFIKLNSEEEIDIDTLSSGEKQIVSLFATLYLNIEEEEKRQFAIFFDEPELSLSLEWQKMLLPDIIASKKCAFLFATTHSPFIFDNNMDQYTADLSEYCSDLKKE